MAGLLGMGGMQGLGGGIPAGLLKNPVLSQLFDPTAMRNYQIKRGLMSAGAAMMNPDPNAPPSGIGGVIGRAAAGGIQGAQAAEGDFYNRGMQNVGLMELQRQYDERDAEQAEIQKILPMLPEGIQSFAKVHPGKFLEAYTEAKLKSMYSTTGADRYGANAYWGQGADGKYHLFQPDKQGGPPNEMQMPNGITPVPGTTYLDTGTSFQPMPTKGMGQGGTPIAKDVAGEAKEKAIGKGEGDAQTAYVSMTSKMPGLEQVVSELRQVGERATYTGAGQIYNWGRKELGMAPTEGAIARTKYIAMVDNQILPLLRDTFGAQFTVQEGESLRATLGDPNKTPQEKQEVLEAFIEQKRRDVESLALQSLGQTPGTTSPNGSRKTSTGVEWSQ